MVETLPSKQDSEGVCTAGRGKNRTALFLGGKEGLGLWALPLGMPPALPGIPEDKGCRELSSAQVRIMSTLLATEPFLQAKPNLEQPDPPHWACPAPQALGLPRTTHAFCSLFTDAVRGQEGEAILQSQVGLLLLGPCPELSLTPCSSWGLLGGRWLTD